MRLVAHSAAWQLLRGPPAGLRRPARQTTGSQRARRCGAHLLNEFVGGSFSAKTAPVYSLSFSSTVRRRHMRSAVVCWPTHRGTTNRNVRSFCLRPATQSLASFWWHTRFVSDRAGTDTRPGTQTWPRLWTPGERRTGLARTTSTISTVRKPPQAPTWVEPVLLSALRTPGRQVSRESSCVQESSCAIRRPRLGTAFPQPCLAGAAQAACQRTHFVPEGPCNAATAENVRAGLLSSCGLFCLLCASHLPGFTQPNVRYTLFSTRGPLLYASISLLQSVTASVRVSRCVHNRQGRACPICSVWWLYPREGRVVRGKSCTCSSRP